MSLSKFEVLCPEYMAGKRNGLLTFDQVLKVRVFELSGLLRHALCGVKFNPLAPEFSLKF